MEVEVGGGDAGVVDGWEGGVGRGGTVVVGRREEE